MANNNRRGRGESGQREGLGKISGGRANQRLPTTQSGTNVADTESKRIQGCGSTGQQEPQVSAGKGLPGRNGTGSGANYWPAEPRLGRDLLDGLPTWMDEPDIPRVGVGIPDRTKRLKGIGNAIVPQIATLIGQAILDVEIPKH